MSLRESNKNENVMRSLLIEMEEENKRKKLKMRYTNWRRERLTKEVLNILIIKDILRLICNHWKRRKQTILKILIYFCIVK